MLRVGLGCLVAIRRYCCKGRDGHYVLGGAGHVDRGLLSLRLLSASVAARAREGRFLLLVRSIVAQ